MTMESRDISVIRNDEQSRYEAQVEYSNVGHLDFEDLGDALMLTHTEIQAEAEGEGYGTELVRGALDDIREQGKLVVPQCSFVAAFIDKNPEYRELVHPNQRGQLGMDSRS